MLSSPQFIDNDQLIQVFHRQVKVLNQLGYALLNETNLLKKLADVRITEGNIPFVIVPTRSFSPKEAIEQVELKGKKGFTSMDSSDLASFKPIESVQIPSSDYLLTDVSTGENTLNLTPEKGLEAIQKQNRTPLTLQEGLALVIQYPDLLKAKNCFYMLGSRSGDRRVTAIWVSKNQSRLGWCWFGNPHTWLGTASVGARIKA